MTAPLAPPDRPEPGEHAMAIGISARAGGKITVEMVQAPVTGDIVEVLSSPTPPGALPVPVRLSGPKLLNIVRFKGELLCIATSCLIPLRVPETDDA